MERGPEHLHKTAMTTLTYRGKTYVQHKEVSQKQLVELTYRRNVYSNRKEDVSTKVSPLLSYRGISYQNKSKP